MWLKNGKSKTMSNPYILTDLSLFGGTFYLYLE